MEKENLEIVSQLNRKSGFNPEIESQKMLQGDIEKTFLPLHEKIAWFKSEFPLGKIHCTETYPALSEIMDFEKKKDILNSIDKVIIECHVYENKQDDQFSFIGEGVGVVYATDPAIASLESEKKYPEMMKMARGTAQSRALYNAGFGLQFYGDEVKLIEELGKSPVVTKTENKSVQSLEVNNTVVSGNGYDPAIVNKCSSVPMPNATNVNVASTGKKRRTNNEIFTDALVELSDLKKEALEVKKEIPSNPTEQQSIDRKIDTLSKKWEKAIKERDKVSEKVDVEIMEKAKHYEDTLEKELMIPDVEEIVAYSAEYQEQLEKNQNEEIAALENLNAIENIAEVNKMFENTENIVENNVEQETLDLEDAPSEKVNKSEEKADEIKDYGSIICTFGTFSGKTYNDIYQSQPNLLLWLVKKELAENEMKAVMHFIDQDAVLKGKFERAS